VGRVRCASANHLSDSIKYVCEAGH
jgi:hypothetical protein